ncbi:hypothetical protein CF326_g2589 [Tilletia indica]|nr:hypothetical protein CF326_g2589 [Tilletia indica]
MVNFTLPVDSPLRSPHLYRLLLISLLIQHSIWHILANTVLKGPHNLKKRSWILTTLAAFVMTAASLPFLRDLFLPPDLVGSLSAGLLHFADFTRSSIPPKLRAVLAEKAIAAAHNNATWGFFSLAEIHPRTLTVTHPLCAFFIAYLLSDLALGAIFYPSMMNMASGWVHHTAYTFFFSYWLHRGWGHIAATAAVFELPTFVMGIACLYPPLRSNMGFTVTFFITRVFLHFGILYATFTEQGRNAPGIDGSWAPFVCVAVTYPMHLFWGYKCILSVRKRMRKRSLSRKGKLEEGLATSASEKPVLNPSEMLQKRRRPNFAENLRLQLPSIAAGAGRFFNGLAPPDTTSALNTPAITPTGGAVPVYANFGSAAPVVALHKAAKAAADRLSRGRKRSSSSIAGSISEVETEPESIGSSSAFERRPSLQGNSKRHSTGGTTTPFGTAAVIPLDAGPEAFDKTPFLAIRSQAETTDRARRLVADALRKAWAQRAPESWKREWEDEERRVRKEREKRAKRRAEAVKAKKAAKELSKREARASSSQSRPASSAGRPSLDGTTDVGDSSSRSSFSIDDVDSIFEDALGGDHLATYTDVESSTETGDEEDDDIFNDPDLLLDDSSAEDEDLNDEAAEAAKLSKMERRKAAARRAIIRAVRRAINGQEPTSDTEGFLGDEAAEDAEADASEEDGPIDEGDFFAQAAREQRRAERAAAKADRLATLKLRSSSSRNGGGGKRRRLFFDRSLAPLDWNAFVKLLPAEFSRDQDSFVVREMQVERGLGANERRKRIVGDLRRRLEIARRDVVVCD